MGKPAVLEDVWAEQVVAAIATLAEAGSEFTCDDVRELVMEPAPHPNAWGSIWSLPGARELQERVPGRAEFSRRPEARGHIMSVRRARRVR